MAGGEREPFRTSLHKGVLRDANDGNVRAQECWNRQQQAATDRRQERRGPLCSDSRRPWNEAVSVRISGVELHASNWAGRVGSDTRRI
jgi:hypothetical protein